MKKNSYYLRLITTGLVTGAMLCGCGSASGTPAGDTAPASDTAVVNVDEKEAETKEAEAPAAQTEGTESGSEENANMDGMANPWKDCTEEEAKAACTRLFKAPEDAVVNGWSMMEVESNENGIPGPMVQLDFRMEGMAFNARAQQGTGENEDISGMNYDWTVTDDVTLANWGEGHMQGKVSRYIEDGWMIDLCTWYDVEIGISYALSVEAEDLDGFDIQAVAEQMYNPDNEPFTGIPDEEDESQASSGFTGQYYAGRGNLTITDKGDNNYFIEVWWGSSASEHSEWTMNGTYDEATKTISYSDCEKHDFTLKEDGSVESDVTAYSNGSGSIKINDDHTINWIDDQDHIADDLVMSN